MFEGIEGWSVCVIGEGRSPFQREADKADLKRFEKAAIVATARAHVVGNSPPRSAIPIRSHHGLWELRVDGNARTFRILFYELTKGEFLAVSFVVKKSRRLPSAVFDAAERRYKLWAEQRPDWDQDA